MSQQKNILITGAAGMLGPMLAARLLDDPQYRVILTDLTQPAVPSGVRHPDHAVCLAADLTDPAAREAVVAAAQPIACAFLFHGIMSAGCEANPQLSQRVNIDATHALLRHLAAVRRGVRVIYASSNAVYGTPLPDPVRHDTLPTPTGTYGAHKFMTEVYINDLHRRGEIDAFSLRFPTVTIRPGAPSASAVAWLSGMVREPLNGLECVIPLQDRSFKATLCAPSTLMDNLLIIMGWKADVLPPHIRGLNMPGIIASVQDMLDALATVCGEDKLRFIREETNAESEKLLRTWAWNHDYSVPVGLGLKIDRTAEDLVREYVDSLKK